MAGLTGLDELFERLFGEGKTPDSTSLGDDLVHGIRAAGNYIAPKEEDAYAETLLKLFREEYESRRCTSMPVTSNTGGCMKIEILGPGCARCRATEENVRTAIAELNLEAEIVHITDLLEISKRRVMLTPGVIVDGKIVSSGRIPDVKEIKEWFTTATAKG